MRILPSVIAGLLALCPVQTRAQVFADFVTDSGNFTAILDYDFAPRTVANFIRLAEGLVPWIDTSTGEVKTGPFYNGLTFYNNTSFIEAECGSPGNTGSGGPGYIFRDDFRSFPESEFSLFMANDGPNTNGSRFFINIPRAVIRSGKYSRFGVVQQFTNPPGGNGPNTVRNISLAAPGFIELKTVTMRYVGAPAQSFRLRVQDPNDPVLSTLPTTREAAFSFRFQPNRIYLDWDNTPGSTALIWASLDLENWIGPSSLMNVPGSNSFGFDITQTVQLAPTGFFYGAVTQYPLWPSTERPLAGAALQAFFGDPSHGAITVQYFFSASGNGGNYQSTFGPGTFTVTKNEVLGPYKSELEITPLTGNLPTYRFTLHYDLGWSTGIPQTALPITLPTNNTRSRLDGFNFAAPGSPLVNGGWTYLPAP